ncbi:hypothetical protein ACJX0J_025603, partial [Zea mays]
MLGKINRAQTWKHYHHKRIAFYSTRIYHEGVIMKLSSSQPVPLTFLSLFILASIKEDIADVHHHKNQQTIHHKNHFIHFGNNLKQTII